VILFLLKHRMNSFYFRRELNYILEQNVRSINRLIRQLKTENKHYTIDKMLFTLKSKRNLFHS